MSAGPVAAVVALAVALAGALGFVAWLVNKALDDRARTADTLFDLATAQGEIERAQFEIEVTAKALTAANARADALEKELSHAIESRPGLGDGLAADDVAGRVLALAKRWREADGGDAGEVPAEPSGPVLDPTPTTAPDAGH